jgi:hypothetical protein
MNRPPRAAFSFLKVEHMFEKRAEQLSQSTESRIDDLKRRLKDAENEYRSLLEEKNVLKAEELRLLREKTRVVGEIELAKKDGDDQSRWVLESLLDRIDADIADVKSYIASKQEEMDRQQEIIDELEWKIDALKGGDEIAKVENLSWQQSSDSGNPTFAIEKIEDETIASNVSNNLPRKTDPLDQNRFDNSALERELGSVLRNHDGNDPAKTLDALDSLSRTLRPSAGKAIEHVPAVMPVQPVVPVTNNYSAAVPQSPVTPAVRRPMSDLIADLAGIYDHPTSGIKKPEVTTLPFDPTAPGVENDGQLPIAPPVNLPERPKHRTMYDLIEDAAGIYDHPTSRHKKKSFY